MGKRDKDAVSVACFARERSRTPLQRRHACSWSHHPSTGRQIPRQPVAPVRHRNDVIAFGFWSGDVNVTEPSYYTYTAPEPATLAQMVLRPEGAHWGPSGTGHLGLLPYAAVRGAPDPRAALLDFFAAD